MTDSELQKLRALCNGVRRFYSKYNMVPVANTLDIAERLPALLDLVATLRAELDRCRPVVEAAESWHEHVWPNTHAGATESWLAGEVDAYRKAKP